MFLAFPRKLKTEEGFRMNEWDAGRTPPLWPPKKQGNWLVRLEGGRWLVVFRPLLGDRDEVIASYPGDQAGERAAKEHAIRLVREAWQW